LIVTVAGTVTLDVSLLVSVIVILLGAGPDRVIGKAVDAPTATVVVGGTPMVTGVVIVTPAVALPALVALAVIVAGPGATPVTANVAVVAPAATVTVAGTVAKFVWSEARLTVKPPVGAGPDKVTVRLPVCPCMMFCVGGVNVIVNVACTVAVAVVKFVAEAVIVDDPNATPVMVG